MSGGVERPEQHEGDARRLAESEGDLDVGLPTVDGRAEHPDLAVRSVVIGIGAGMEVSHRERGNDTFDLGDTEAEIVQVLLPASPRHVNHLALRDRLGDVVRRPDEFDGESERFAALRTCIA